MSKKSSITIEYAILTCLILWSILSVIASRFLNHKDITLTSIIFGAFFSGLIGFKIIQNPGRMNFFRILSGISETLIGIIVLIIDLNFNYVLSCIFIVIGCQLIGCSLGAYFGINSSASSGTTRRPEIISPEPEPAPKPF